MSNVGEVVISRLLLTRLDCYFLNLFKESGKKNLGFEANKFLDSQLGDLEIITALTNCLRFECAFNLCKECGILRS